MLLPVPRTNPLPEREIGICSRVKQVREMAGLSRVQFAAELGVDTAIVGRCELRRAALKFGLAYEIISAFAVGPQWLATGNGAHMSGVQCPSPEDLDISRRALFSDVFDRVIAGRLAKEFARERLESEHGLAAFREEIRTSYPPTPEGRMAALLALRVYLLEWLAEVSAARFSEFVTGFVQLGNGLLNELGRDPNDVYLARVDKMVDAYFRRRRMEDKLLKTESSVDRLLKREENSDVSLTWKQLKSRLKAATQRRGKRAELASAIDVYQSRLNSWLDKSSEPGAEATFRLLEWVIAQEGQSSGITSLTPAPTTPAKKPRAKARRGRKPTS
jgi:DNA-binding XRE family transcriptional regulator